MNCIVDVSGSSEAAIAAGDLSNACGYLEEVLNFSEALVAGGKERSAPMSSSICIKSKYQMRDKNFQIRALADSNGYEELANAAHTLASSAGQVGAWRESGLPRRILE